MQQSDHRAKGPELFIGLASPVGTDLETVVDSVCESLADFRYPCTTIRLADLLRDLDPWKDLPTGPVYEYVSTHMNAGNELRRLVGSSPFAGFDSEGTKILWGALATLAMARIWKERGPALHEAPGRRAYILRSLKHPDEVRTLRDVYGDAFVLIGVYSPHELRRRHLAQRIADSRHEPQFDRCFPEAEELIQRDQAEDDPFGQQVRDTFHRSDFFVDASDRGALRSAVSRFVELVFANTFHTPTRDEYCMFLARAVALRSAELGRQVGAVVATREGDVIAVGTNEVPKAGGGLYWPGDTPDRREFVNGFDSNDRQKRRVVTDLFNRLRKARWLRPEEQTKDAEQLLKLAEADGMLKDSQIMSLIEFGRAVHAEMAALNDAARRGVSVDGATLFVTTFPCHLCARQIVAAGIKRVVYIEPYAKSLTAELYPDSIAVDVPGPVNGHVTFEPFVGVAPRRYMALFTMTERKRQDGTVATLNKMSAIPRCRRDFISYSDKEAKQLNALKSAMVSTGIIKKEKS